MNRIPQTQQELKDHLTEQMGFLRSSSEAFDQGNLSEAKRIASAIRTLVKDSRPPTVALLTLLGVKGSMKFANVCGSRSGSAAPALLQCGTVMAWSVNGLKYEADLGEPEEFIPFEDWWGGLLIASKWLGVEISRSMVVLGMAEQDGGAHVDQGLNELYHKLSRGNAMGWEDYKGDNPFINSPAPFLVRSIAHELEISIANCPQLI